RARAGSGMGRRLNPRLLFWVGVILLLGYWFHLHPPGFGRIGYSEDMGGIDMSRILMSDAIKATGKPGFYSHRLMAPFGIAVPYYSWLMERDWSGAYVWLW